MANLASMIESISVDRLQRRDTQALIYVAISSDIEATRLHIFENWLAKQVLIDMVSQAYCSLDGDDGEVANRVNIAVSLDAAQLDVGLASLSEVTSPKGGASDNGSRSSVTAHSKTDLSSITLIGSGMRSHAGVAANMFSTLSAADIPVYIVSTSEIKISCLVDTDCATRAMSELATSFQISVS